MNDKNKIIRILETLVNKYLLGFIVIFNLVIKTSKRQERTLVSG